MIYIRATNLKAAEEIYRHFKEMARAYLPAYSKEKDLAIARLAKTTDKRYKLFVFDPATHCGAQVEV